MNTIKTVLFICLMAFVNFSFLHPKNNKITTTNSLALGAFNLELCNAYNTGENLVLIDENGSQILNPNKEDLQNLTPELFEQNRVRVTIMGRSDNNLCSTELVVMDESGGIIGNYTINNCSSYGWIFFTESNCFEVALYHDAGLEAPYGSSINGSVDWTFQFNNKTRISGTYMDMGAANMFKVANPCYNTKEISPISAVEAKRRMENRVSPLGF